MQRVFALTGAPDHVLLRAFLQFGHNYNGVSRAVMYDWFNRHLRLGFNPVPKERPFVPLSVAEASVWDAAHPKPAGGPAHERALLKWMTDDAAAAMAAVAPADAASARRFSETVGGAFSVLLGGPLRRDDAVRLDDRGTVARRDRHHPDWDSPARIERCGAAGRLVVAQLRAAYRNLGVARRQVLFAHDAPGRRLQAVERLLASGYEVLGIDVLGQGELQLPEVTFDPVRLASERAHAGFTFGYNLPLPAERVQDVLTAIRFARDRVGPSGRVLLLASGPAAAWAAGARALAGTEVDRAALDPQGFRFGAVTRIDSPEFLPGAAKYGDVPALLALSAPGELWFTDTVQAAGSLDVATAAYRSAGASGRLTVAAQTATMDDAIAWAVR